MVVVRSEEFGPADNKWGFFIDFQRSLLKDERLLFEIETEGKAINGATLPSHVCVTASHPMKRLMLRTIFPSHHPSSVIYRVFALSGKSEDVETVLVNPVTLTVERPVPQPTFGHTYYLVWTDDDQSKN
jgi:hypothetical protein